MNISNIPLSIFKRLTDDEISDFENAARRDYTPGEPVNALWHPAYRTECERMNLEWVQGPTLDESAAAPDCELHERHIATEKAKHHGG